MQGSAAAVEPNSEDGRRAGGASSSEDAPADVVGAALAGGDLAQWLREIESIGIGCSGACARGDDMARVLIVDDMAAIRRMLTRLLNGRHDVVGELPDGDGAACEVESNRPDIVIMDQEMPVTNGVDATRQIKTRSPNVVVVGYTSSGETMRGQMLRAGADAVFPKTKVTGLLEFVNEVAVSSSPRAREGER